MVYRANGINKICVYIRAFFSGEYSFHFFYFYGGVKVITELFINEQIRDKEVRVIDTDGAQLGIMSSKDAQRLADEKKMDLVKIAPQAKPPVCKIIDYGKYRFDLAKKEKEARKKQKIVELKELRLSPSIGVHDLQVKEKQAVEFLQDGDKVKVSIRFKFRREMVNLQASTQILLDFAKKLEAYGIVEKLPKLEAKSLAMFMAPKA